MCRVSLKNEPSNNSIEEIRNHEFKSIKILSKRLPYWAMMIFKRFCSRYSFYKLNANFRTIQQKIIPQY